MSNNPIDEQLPYPMFQRRKVENYETNLDGDLICKHKQLEFCCSATNSNCQICVDCGEHSNGFPMKPKIIYTRKQIEAMI